MDRVRERTADWLDDRGPALAGMVAGFVGCGCLELVVVPAAGGVVTGVVAAVGAAYGYRWGRAAGVLTGTSRRG